MTNKNKIAILFFTIIIWLNYYLSWIIGLLSMIFSILLYWTIIYIFVGVYKELYYKDYVFFDRKNFYDFFIIFFQKIINFIIIIIFILWWFAYYNNEISPAIMPIYTVSNWDKTLVFQSMSHIWTQSFYNWVKNNIEKYKKQWFVYYFEWVKQWTKENHEKFDKALWVKFDQKTYETMAKLYWLVNQDNSLFLWLVNKNDKNVDVWMDEIIKNYEDLKITNNTSKRTYKEPLDASKIVYEELSKLNDRQLKIIRYLNKSMVSFIIKSEWFQEVITSEFANKELFDVILNKRNEVLTNEIINSQDKKIITTYWLLHFKWVLDLLQKKDIKWQITNIDYSYPIKN